MFIERKLDLILLKRFDLISFDPVCHFRLATESDDSVAKSVGLDFYCFVNKYLSNLLFLVYCRSIRNGSSFDEQLGDISNISLAF
jgi:hypothetical protein